MANEQNLIANSERTPSELLEMTRKGGIASGEARRKKKLFREILNDGLDEDTTMPDGTVVTKKEKAAYKLINILITDDDVTAGELLRTFEVIRDTIGEKPKEQISLETEVIRIGFEEGSD